MISEVRSGTVYVDANPGLADSLRSKLGWTEADADDYPTKANSFDTVTDDEVRLLDAGSLW